VHGDEINKFITQLERFKKIIDDLDKRHEKILKKFDSYVKEEIGLVDTFSKFNDNCFMEKDKYFKSMKTFSKLLSSELKTQKELIKKLIFNPLQILQVQHATLKNLVLYAQTYLSSRNRTNRTIEEVQDQADKIQIEMDYFEDNIKKVSKRVFENYFKMKENFYEFIKGYREKAINGKLGSTELTLQQLKKQKETVSEYVSYAAFEPTEPTDFSSNQEEEGE